jgi:hypothetical protein
MPREPEFQFDIFLSHNSKDLQDSFILDFMPVYPGAPQKCTRKAITKRNSLVGRRPPIEMKMMHGRPLKPIPQFPTLYLQGVTGNILSEEPKLPTQAREAIPILAKPGRNDQCRCGSGIKFKRCCLGKAS